MGSASSASVVRVANGTIVLIICGGTSMDMVARAAWSALEVGVEGVVDEVAEDGAELLDVLDAVDALPLGGFPLVAGDVAPAGEAGPVGFDQGAAVVFVGLPGGRCGDRGVTGWGCGDRLGLGHGPSSVLRLIIEARRLLENIRYRN